MKKKDINLIMAAVAVLVMLKTMMNRAFNEVESEEEIFDFEEDEDDDEYNHEPSSLTDEEYEYFNEVLETVNLEEFEDDDLDGFDLNTLLQSFSDSLEFKLAIMKNSDVLKELFLRKQAEGKEVEGEAISDV